MNDRQFQQIKGHIQTGDERGLGYVFEQTGQYCTRTLVKKTSCTWEDAEDIFMDSMLIFRENMISGKLKELTNLKTYVFGICWNLWRDLNRARQKWQKEENEIERQMLLLMAEGNGHFGEDDGEIMRSKVQLVCNALNGLGEKCKQLLSYVYVEKRPQKEIASLMGFASPNVVKVTRHRCYQQWMKQIEKTNS